jgi:hypothetical protein
MTLHHTPPGGQTTPVDGLDWYAMHEHGPGTYRHSHHISQVHMADVNNPHANDHTGVERITWDEVRAVRAADALSYSYTDADVELVARTWYEGGARAVLDAQVAAGWAPLAAVFGYVIDGKTYHPANVTVVFRSPRR